MKNQVAGTELESLFNTYFSTIIYLEDKHLKDRLHWNDKFIIKKRAEFLKKIKEKLGGANRK